MHYNSFSAFSLKLVVAMAIAGDIDIDLHVTQRLCAIKSIVC
jgi:hypothetical protein